MHPNAVKIRSKIIAFQVFFIALVLVTAGVDYFAVQRADYYIDRVAYTHRQLERITELSLHANRYSEQIAEMLLFGEEGREEFEEARRDVERSFQTLEQLSRDELAFISNPQEQESEYSELVVISQMREITQSMHTVALELLHLTLSGREDEARLRYYGEIEENLDDKLQTLIDLAITDEREEVSRVDTETARLTRELIIFVASAIILAIAASVGAVMLLSRALARPIARLTEGASAIGSGQLDHRIPVVGRDELALLSGHFNRMAEQLERQRHELLQQQALLERKVSERTHELEEANRRLEDLDRLRTLFLADISHELRTPLTVLRGEAEVTLRSRGARIEDYHETLERIVDQAEHMGRLVEDLLFLTRAEADSIRFQVERVRLDEVFQEAVREGQVLAAANGNRLQAQPPPTPLHVVGDRQRLKQIALIALDNAIKYSHPRTDVEVKLQAEGEQVVARVCNRGEGIPGEDLPYVFERFYRGRHGKGPGGSGLGLSIAKWIVEKHGGTIALRNGPEDGTTELEIRLRRAS